MPRATDAGPQRIGWNGTAMEVPPGWQPVVILADYLLFEDRYQPVLEMKWQQATGRLSPQRVMRQLGRGKNEAVEPWNIPTSWQQALQRFTATGFRWQNENNSGRGVLLHCTHCGRATLVRFYGRGPEDACLHLLQTLRDHPEKNTQQWAVYDITFTLPASARVQSQEFLTGSYTIDFAMDDLYFSLLRMKPAAVLLADTDLRTFGTRLLQHGEQPAADGGSPLEAAWAKKASPWQRLRAKLRRRQADHVLRLRHDPRHNVILGIRARSNRPIPEDTVQTIFSNYEARVPCG
jgi:hypothetical protein